MTRIERAPELEVRELDGRSQHSKRFGLGRVRLVDRGEPAVAAKPAVRLRESGEHGHADRVLDLRLRPDALVERLPEQRDSEAEHEPEDGAEERHPLWARLRLERPRRGPDDPVRSLEKLERLQPLLVLDEARVQGGILLALRAQIRESLAELSQRDREGAGIQLAAVLRERLRVGVDEADSVLTVAGADGEAEHVRIRLRRDAVAAERSVRAQLLGRALRHLGRARDVRLSLGKPRGILVDASDPGSQ